mmetsp:Transcript_3271/g.8338  ORF Transcript_3271/g.8338 Transcript_3271/m.8338 type:complete len:144 (+) Transcript_3271:3-434(+)
MIDLMDTDGSGSVNKSEFCRCLLQIAENSEDLRPMLMMELHYDSMSFLKSKLSDFETKMEQSKMEQRDDRNAILESVQKLMRQMDAAKARDDAAQAPVATQKQCAQIESSLTYKIDRLEDEVRLLRSAVSTLSSDLSALKGEG